MRSTLSSPRRRGSAVLAAAALSAGLAATLSPSPASAGPEAHPSRAAQVTSASVHRGGADRTIAFRRAHAGEVFLTTTVSAPGVSWADPGNESAVVSAYVDGHYATDIVITSAKGITRQFALGHLGKGRHTLTLKYAGTRSPSDAGVARLRDLSFRTVRPRSAAYVAAEYAPVLYGRDDSTRIPKGNKFANNHTDTPLLAWHETTPAQTPGHSVIQYSVVWSNEDGGTLTPSLMAQWGRTTDIEWIYRVEVDAQGKRVAGSGEFQAPGHDTLEFKGRYDGTHPVLQTCTINNNVCDGKPHGGRIPTPKPDPMRFSLSTLDTLAPGLPRENLMDRHPWTYPVMAREMEREGKVEMPGDDDATTLAMSDQRNYLYLALDSTPGDDNVGLAIDVTLRDDDTTYSSDHENQFAQLYTIHRSGPAATTVELPAGTTQDDITSISARRVTPLVPSTPGSGAPIEVTGIQRAFFLDSDYLPEPSFLTTALSVELTAAAPTAELWHPTE